MTTIYDEDYLEIGTIKCECGTTFKGTKGKEDTCPKCLKKILRKGDEE